MSSESVCQVKRNWEEVGRCWSGAFRCRLSPGISGFALVSYQTRSWTHTHSSTQVAIHPYRRPFN
jgi:hypothetical protein